VLELGIVFGAVYRPDELIVPVAELPPATLFTSQVTAVFDDPVTIALNDFVAPTRTFALAGETATVTVDPEGGGLGLEDEALFVVPVQPASAAAISRNTRGSERCKANFFNFSIRKHTESASHRRRIARTELWFDVGRGTTVRRAKIRYGTPEQDGHYSFGFRSMFDKRLDASRPLSLNSKEYIAVIRNINRSSY
jgi:hypothetical protein